MLPQLNKKISSNRSRIYNRILDTIASVKDDDYNHEVLKLFLRREFVKEDFNTHVERLDTDIEYMMDIVSCYLLESNMFTKIEMYCAIGLRHQYDLGEIDGYLNQNFKKVWRMLIIEDIIFLKDNHYFLRKI